ncbi:MAG: citrate/2-methylcitrate synthase, partial [Blastocatellia bacterium]
MSSDSNVAKAGLEGVVATQSAICEVNGIEGRLVYRGYDIHDLAENATFEEVAYLLLNGVLPNSSQLTKLKAELGAEFRLPREIIGLIESLPKDVSPMDMLRTMISALALYDREAGDMSTDANLRKAIRLIARFPVVVTAFHRIRAGLLPVEPRPDLSIAGNFLYMLRGELRDEVATRTIDVAFILHADHELNASTFAARVTAATLSDIYSAIVSAIGALKGPLHG